VAPAVSITSPANGTSFTAPATVTITANASDSDGTVAKVEFLSGSTVLGLDTTSPFSFTWANVPAGTYTLTARATDSAGLTATSAAVTVTVSALPSAWVGRDIGAVGVPGSFSVASGVFTIRASGTDIWGSTDEFYYVYQPMSGDGEITARVTGLQNTAPWAQAGVMIRETLTGNSRHAFMMVSAQNGLDLEYRTTTGGPTAEVYRGNNGRVPVWVRLVRTGNTFKGYYSTDGVSWTLQGSVTVTMGSSVYIGLGVSSLKNTVLNTATLDNVRVVP
jgi:hypothetical protein